MLPPDGFHLPENQCSEIYRKTASTRNATTTGLCTNKTFFPKNKILRWDSKDTFLSKAVPILEATRIRFGSQVPHLACYPDTVYSQSDPALGVSLTQCHLKVSLS